VCFTQPLNGSLPAPELPDGFRFVPAMLYEDADQRADVHYNAFNPSRMTGDFYRRFMTAPGYNPELDIVTVAPDGRFASFAMGWIDPANKLSVFEPVGTRSEFQHKGLGKATLREGLRRLKARGVETATVCAHATNASNIAFYESAGFKLVNRVYGYSKRV
jgi:mycothiol synthase